MMIPDISWFLFVSRVKPCTTTIHHVKAYMFYRRFSKLRNKITMLKFQKVFSHLGERLDRPTLANKVNRFWCLCAVWYLPVRARDRALTQQRKSACKMDRSGHTHTHTHTKRVCMKAFAEAIRQTRSTVDATMLH